MKMATMTRFALLFVLAMLVGCSSNNKGKIEGTKWTSQAASVKGQTIPAGALTLEFKADGSMIYGIIGMNKTGKYSLGMGDTVTFKMDEKLGERKDHAEKIKIEGDVLTMTDSDGTALKFNRAK
jgi:uncharacterized lipoprotein NlpE involved in copper resistance